MHRVYDFYCMPRPFVDTVIHTLIFRHDHPPDQCPICLENLERGRNDHYWKLSEDQNLYEELWSKAFSEWLLDQHIHLSASQQIKYVDIAGDFLVWFCDQYGIESIDPVEGWPALQQYRSRLAVQDRETIEALHAFQQFWIPFIEERNKP